MSRIVIALSLIFAFGSAQADEAEIVFSGPQPGEPVPSFVMNGVRGDEAGKPIDLIGKAAEGPLLIVFFHEKTRPAFSLTNAIVRFAETRSPKGLTAGIVFLTADATETASWLRTVNPMLPSRALLGISPDGQEGPGAWGLNRNVALTVIVANEGKVTSNFALRQPSLDVDGPKILQAIVDVTGGGPVPPISDFAGPQRQAASVRRMNEKTGDRSAEVEARLRQLLSPVINREATEEAVTAAAGKVEEQAARDPVFRKRVAEATRRIIEADKLASYGTPKAQEFLAKWSKEFAEPPGERK